MKNPLWSRIEEARSKRNVLEHSFYQRWSAGELTIEELGHYAGEYRHAVEAIARLSANAARAADAETRAGLLRHAAEEQEHVELWDGFLAAVGGSAATEPAPETAECVRAWTRDDLVGALVALYSIESGQPDISRTKQEGLRSFYGFEDGPATAYFRLHSELDVEHAAQARELIEPLLEDADEDELVAISERVFEGNWALLDGVERAFGR